MAFEDWSQSIVASPAASVGRRRTRPSPLAPLGLNGEGGVAGSRLPAADSLATPLNAPRPLMVEMDAATGEPLLLRRNGRQQRVRAVQNAWRIDDEWWRQPISRQYYELVLTGGTLLTVF